MTPRSATIALAFAAILVAAPAAHADTASDMFAGFQASSKDPIQVDAQALDVHEDGNQRISVFSGGVTVKRGNTLMKAGTVTLYSGAGAPAGTAAAPAANPAAAPAANGTAAPGGLPTEASAFTRIEATGKVFVSSGDQTVTGDSVVVDMKANTITVSGGVVLSQGGNVISGSRLIVNLSTGRARVEQDPGKQIRGVFSPNGAMTPSIGGSAPAQ
jgi:lipopolysaccharide export system protein LptA